MRHAIVFGLAVISMIWLSQVAVAQNNFYIFGAIGNSDADSALGGQNRVDDNDGSFTLGGGYEFNENVSLEAAYEDFGTYAGQTDCPPDFFCLLIPLRTRAEITALSISLVGSIQISDRLDGYARLGLTSWDVKFDGISSAFDDSGEDPHYGIGVRWSFEDDWNVFAEYTQVDLDVDTVRIGMRYNF